MAASKFTDENRIALLELRRDGATLKEAVLQVEVSEKTVKGWLTRGRREDAEVKDGEYFDFAVEWERASGEAEAEAMAPMTREEVMEHLSRMIRAGSIKAAEVWLKENPRGDDGAEQPTGLDALDAEDDLARQRKKRGA